MSNNRPVKTARDPALICFAIPMGPRTTPSLTCEVAYCIDAFGSGSVPGRAVLMAGKLQNLRPTFQLYDPLSFSMGKPNIHVHTVLAKRDGSTCGGHLIEARVRPTLEVILTESPHHLTRRFDRESGLALISLDEQR